MIFLYVLKKSISLYSESLQAGRSGERISAEARFCTPVQNGPRAHPVSCTMGTESVSGAGAWG